MWGATPAAETAGQPQKISIHAPRVGRDGGLRQTQTPRNTFQSTRPVWGATFDVRKLRAQNHDFNPRAPCGARLSSVHFIQAETTFQSTRPVWGATKSSQTININSRISIHAPRVGRDDEELYMEVSVVNFNPRAPCGARQHWVQLLGGVEVISIHAPRVGRDYRIPGTVNHKYKFQSTRPVWGATLFSLSRRSSP